MNPGNLAVPLRRNAPAAMRLQLFCRDANGVEVPMNITGYTLKLEVRLYPGQPGDPMLSLATGDHIAIEAGASGYLEINWPEVVAGIAALPTVSEAGDPLVPRVDTFAYDLLLIAPDGSAQAILEGPVPVSFGVTQND